MSSEIINLIPNNPDVHIYQKAVEILANELPDKYSFIINTWNGEMPTHTKHKRILISTSDETHNIPIQLRDKEYVHIFKQYAPMKNINDSSSVIHMSNVSPLPLGHLLGVESGNIKINNRELDWCWMGQFDPYKRVQFKKAINELDKNKYFKKHVLWYTGWNNGIDKKQYSEIVNNTKIMFVPTGSASMESFRFFEAMMCGCIVICIDMPKVDFYNVASMIKIKQWSNLEAIVYDILSKKEEIEYMSLQAKSWYDFYCSPRGLANYMKRKINV